MARKREHLRQALRNQEVCTLLGQVDSKYLDWVITTIFYNAIHHIEAAFACINDVAHSEVCKRRDESNSSARWRLIKQHFTSDCAFYYSELETASKCVRYLLTNYNSYYNKDVVEKFIDEYLPCIINEASNYYDKP